MDSLAFPFWKLRFLGMCGGVLGEWFSYSGFCACVVWGEGFGGGRGMVGMGLVNYCTYQFAGQGIGLEGFRRGALAYGRPESVLASSREVRALSPLLGAAYVDTRGSIVQYGWHS